MKNPQKICFVSPEVSPFVKESPISEVANALPMALKELGHDVRVMMPNYKFVNERKYVLRDVIRLKDMAVQLGGREIKVSAKSAFLPDSKVQIYFLDNKAYFGREGLYADPKTGRPYPDNDERFAAFCLGCIQTLRMLHWQPDVIHCFDWPTGLMPLVLKLLDDEDNFFQKTKVAFTVSDFTAQGNFPAETLQKIGLAEKISASDPSVALEGHVSFLKAGLSMSDLIILSSESHQQTLLQTPELAPNLQEFLPTIRHKFIGMVNGIDDKAWDPETDSHLSVNYNLRSISRKAENKKWLLEKLSLPYSPEIPLLATISPVTEEKGAALLLDAFEKMMALKLQWVILEQGDSKALESLKMLAKKFANQVAFLPGREEAELHQVIAAVDMAIFPARVETSGKEAFYCLRYGTVPIVKSTGVYADTIIDFDVEKEQGIGFTFAEDNADALLEAINDALQVYRESKKWQKLLKNGMKQDFSWKAIAGKYAKVYAKIAAQKK